MFEIVTIGLPGYNDSIDLGSKALKSLKDPVHDRWRDKPVIIISDTSVTNE